MCKRWKLVAAIVVLVPVGAAAGEPAAAGRSLYQQTCIACHGPDGRGVLPGMASLRAADGPLSQTDEVLLRSILDGKQSANSPLTMPPRGGNPSLTEADARALVAFLRAEFGRP
ncbi:MAG: cytochrome c, class I [Gammaproteobacteria bacterium]|nr:cytochrome c, class I [Gammaproteobacteria bacterium]